ncbi:hypothetical protein QYF36_000165 [Acer negundo]|nr:hypothetical protein QYF36_000165 [Acer negundo]
MRNDIAVKALWGDKMAEINFTASMEKQAHLVLYFNTPCLEFLWIRSSPQTLTTDPYLMVSSSFFKKSPKEIHNPAKWKIVARNKPSLSELEEILSLGKRESLELEEDSQITAKRAKEGLIEGGNEVYWLIISISSQLKWKLRGSGQLKFRMWKIFSKGLLSLSQLPYMRFWL